MKLLAALIFLSFLYPGLAYRRLRALDIHILYTSKEVYLPRKCFLGFCRNISMSGRTSLKPWIKGHFIGISWFERFPVYLERLIGRLNISTLTWRQPHRMHSKQWGDAGRLKAHSYNSLRRRAKSSQTEWCSRRMLYDRRMLCFFWMRTKRLKISNQLTYFLTMWQLWIASAGLHCFCGGFATCLCLLIGVNFILGFKLHTLLESFYITRTNNN